jgi:uncharacterized protein YutE (UPF0331/DUF86 family)
MPDESHLARLELLDQYVRDLRDAQPPNFAAYESDKMMVEFRNLLVYARDGVDDMLAYGFAKKRVGDFVDFCNGVRVYLQQTDAENSSDKPFAS